MQFRQGDVLLELVENVAPGACRIVAPTGQLLVASGKDGTHAHVLDAGTDIAAWRLAEGAGGPDYLVVGGKGARLCHEEHAPLALPGGCYRVIRQHEYDPVTAATILVRD